MIKIVGISISGFVSYRHESEGSLFINILADTFRKYAKRFHAVDMLTIVRKILLYDLQVTVLFERL